MTTKALKGKRQQEMVTENGNLTCRAKEIRKTEVTSEAMQAM
jgi:hypothetical protein